MPGWIAVAIIPEPEDPDAPCAVCGKVHPKDEQHSVQVGPFVVPMPGAGESVRIIRGIVLEVGDLPTEAEHVIPYAAGATIHFTNDKGTMIGGALFMHAQNVIAWE